MTGKTPRAGKGSSSCGGSRSLRGGVSSSSSATSSTGGGAEARAAGAGRPREDALGAAVRREAGGWEREKVGEERGGVGVSLANNVMIFDRSKPLESGSMTQSKSYSDTTALINSTYATVLLVTGTVRASILAFCFRSDGSYAIL